MTTPRLLRRIGWVLLWASVVVLGLFGAYFSLANYPWFGATVVLLILLLIAASEHRRRTARKSRETARRRARLSE